MSNLFFYLFFVVIIVTLIEGFRWIAILWVKRYLRRRFSPWAVHYAVLYLLRRDGEYDSIQDYLHREVVDSSEKSARMHEFINGTELPEPEIFLGLFVKYGYDIHRMCHLLQAHSSDKSALRNVDRISEDVVTAMGRTRDEITGDSELLRRANDLQDLFENAECFKEYINEEVPVIIQLAYEGQCNLSLDKLTIMSLLKTLIEKGPANMSQEDLMSIVVYGAKLPFTRIINYKMSLEIDVNSQDIMSDTFSDNLTDDGRIIMRVRGSVLDDFEFSSIGEYLIWHLPGNKIRVSIANEYSSSIAELFVLEPGNKVENGYYIEYDPMSCDIMHFGNALAIRDVERVLFFEGRTWQTMLADVMNWLLRRRLTKPSFLKHSPVSEIYTVLYSRNE